MTAETWKWNLLKVSAIGASILLLMWLHFWTAASQSLWYNVIEHMYNLIIAVAAIFFGWKGGIGAALVSMICYSAPLLLQTPVHHLVVGQTADVVDFFIIGVVAGVLADRERKQKCALQSANNELNKVYQELQNNYERMKRSERLYAIGQLSAGLAHEVRNPLASIEGAVTILQQNPESADTRQEFLEIIQKEGRRLNRLLTNFLEFARPREPQYRYMDIGSILDSVINLASHGLGQKAIVLRKELEPDIPHLECDPEQLQQVILNLTINAVQATPGSGDIVLRAKGGRGRIQIDVTDQGCGVRSDLLDRIFDPFFTSKENGTGLGLSVAHQIISQHGGALTAKNNPRGGMTFTVLLPIKHGGVL